MKVKSSEQPKKAQMRIDKQGRWMFIWGVTEYDNSTEEQSDSGYEYNAVTVWGIPTFESVLAAAIRERYSESEEFALVNGYNEYRLGVHDDESKEQEYLDFLRWRRVLKDGLKAAFEAETETEETEAEGMPETGSETEE